MHFTIEDMRDTILGKMPWRKCPICDGTGFENWDEDGGDVKSGRSGNPDRTEGECENCDSLGFVRDYV